MEIQYRLANLSDIDSLVQLRIQMQSERSGAEAPPEYADVAAEYFRRVLNDGSYIGAVAEHDGLLVAGSGMVIFPKPPKFRDATGFQGYITNVFTLPEWRCRGIAGALIKILVLEAQKRKVDGIHLSSSAQGQSVYRGVGFKESTQQYFELRL